VPSEKTKSSHLIISDDGTLYHIDLKRADNIPPNLFFVGAAGRVDAIAHQFDSITFRHRNKERPEFYIVSGIYKGVKGVPMAAFSCGIGVSVVEIAVNEFHALFEYDHTHDIWIEEIPKVNIIRVGTAGTSLEEIPVGSIAISDYSLGFDALGAFYTVLIRNDTAVSIEKRFLETRIGEIDPLSYCSMATPLVSKTLKRKAYELGESSDTVFSGITTASPGFYGPEGRRIGRTRTVLDSDEFLRNIQMFREKDLRIVNHEMETSILFRIAYEILGYNVGALCVVLDNLATDRVELKGDVIENRMNQCIQIALETMVELVHYPDR